MLIVDEQGFTYHQCIVTYLTIETRFRSITLEDRVSDMHESYHTKDLDSV